MLVKQSICALVSSASGIYFSMYASTCSLVHATASSNTLSAASIGTFEPVHSSFTFIPYFANWPNGGWFVVQDRFGEDPEGYKYAFDILMGSHDACNQVGKRELEVYIYM